MTFRRILVALVAACAALAALPAPAAAPNWLATVAVTPAGSHLRGNPQAKVKLTAYVSYTCPHCAAFERESAGALALAYVGTGKVSFELKHLLRDPVDATVAQLANCGPAAKFFGNNEAFFRGQNQWIAPLSYASQAQRQRWMTGDNAARRRAIASDFHLYEIMEKRGYKRTDLDRCLADEALARRLAAQTVEADKLGFDSTPSFMLDGSPLFGTYTWQQVEAQLRARL